MDTNILTHQDIGPETMALSARLPGEVEGVSHDGDVQNEHPTLEAAERPPTSARAPSKRRGMLLAGVAATTVVVVGAGAFFLSPYNHVYPMPHLASTVRDAAASAGVKLPGVLAPSASLASVTLPPPTPPATRDHYAARPRQDEVAELLALHPAATDRTGGVVPAPGPLPAGQPERAPATRPPVPASPPPSMASAAGADLSDLPTGYVPGEPGAVAQPTRTRDATSAILAALPAAGKATAEPVPAAPPLPAPLMAKAPPPSAQTVSAAPAVADPIAVARELRAAPLATPDQVQVLGLVTEMASVVKHLREQDAQLRADFGKASADTTARLADYERRLAMAEAKTAVTAANDTATPAPVEAAADNAPIVAKAVSVTRALAVLRATPGSTAATSYRVQAASPGLALLAEVDRGGGEGAQMQVVVGDTIPAYGRVKSIAQKGTVWVVTTEHGQIQ